MQEWLGLQGIIFDLKIWYWICPYLLKSPSSLSPCISSAPDTFISAFSKQCFFERPYPFSYSYMFFEWRSFMSNKFENAILKKWRGSLDWCLHLSSRPLEALRRQTLPIAFPNWSEHKELPSWDTYEQLISCWALRNTAASFRKCWFWTRTTQYFPEKYMSDCVYALPTFFPTISLFSSTYICRQTCGLYPHEYSLLYSLHPCSVTCRYPPRFLPSLTPYP